MRQSIYIDGFSHGNNPIPAACLHHNHLITGAIFGTDTSIGKIPELAEQQCHFMFDNAQQILEKANATWDDVVKMTFLIKPDVDRALINRYWVEAFPDEKTRPARHVIVSHTLPATQYMQCDFLAILDKSN